MERQTRINFILLLSVVFIGFFVFGLSENVKGPAIPRIGSDFGLSESRLGMLLALNSLGYLVACTYTSWLARRIGIKLTGIVAFVSMALSGIFICLSVSFPALTASYFLLYLGNGMLEIGLAIMAARIFTKRTGMMMNLAHFFYGVSSIVAPVAAAKMMGWQFAGDDIGWRGMYVIMLSLALLPVIPSLIGRFPRGREESGMQGSFRLIMRDPASWLIVAVLSFGVVSELSVGNWLVYYLEKVHDWSMEDASWMLSLFFVSFTLARLVLGPITDRIGYTMSLLIFSAFSGLCNLAAILIGEQGAWLFALSGAGIAPIYPTVMALLSKRYGNIVDIAITFTVTLMGIACVLGHYAIGFIIDGARALFAARGMENSLTIGLQIGYGFIALFALICSAVCGVLLVYLRRRNQLL